MRLLALQQRPVGLRLQRPLPQQRQLPTWPHLGAGRLLGQPLGTQQVGRGAGGVCAARRRGGSDREPHDYNLDHFVSFDEEDEWETQGTRVTPSARPFVAQLFSAVTIVVDRLTDLAFTFVPQGVSVRVVRTAVSGGLVLLVLGFAKSVLGFLFTLGSLVLGAYIAVRILGIDLAGVATEEPEEFKQAAKRKGPGRRESRGRQSEFKGLLSGSQEDEDGLLEVWFERNKDKYSRGKGRG